MTIAPSTDWWTILLGKKSLATFIFTYLRMAWQGCERFKCLHIWLTVALSLTKKIILPSWLLISSPLLSLFDFHIIFVSLIEFQPKKNFPTIPLLLQLSLKNSLGKRWKIVMFARLTDWLSYQRKTLQPSSSCLDKLRSTCVGNDEFDHFYCVGDVIITKQWEMCAS